VPTAQELLEEIEKAKEIRVEKKKVIKPLKEMVAERAKIKPKIEIAKKKVPTAQELLEEIEKAKEIRVEKEKIVKPLKRKVVERLKIRPSLTKEKLEEQLKLLEESYKSGLISKEAYNKDKNKINDMLRKLG